MVIVDKTVRPAGWRRAVSRPRVSFWTVQRLALQILITVGFLAAWEYLPRIDWISDRVRILDPFIISSPSEIGRTINYLATGAPEANGIVLRPYLEWTLRATIEGAVIGLMLGALVGLVFSQSRRISEVFSPFIVLVNTVPRIALIPIFIIVAGPGITSEVLSVIAVVFFLAFFNAYEGGRSLNQAMLDNASLLGASSLGTMFTIRLPVVIKWTFAVIPNAISFGLVIAVTTELLAGLPGMGNLLLTATTNIDADLTFAVITVLSVVGVLLYFGAQLLYRLVVRW